MRKFKFQKFSNFCSINKSAKANIYVTKSTNIVFNLSTEEFFYEHQNIDKPMLLLYQNDKNVVIGKHQNPWKECNIKLMEEENVNLARRRSGGGAVYQDLGNLCFSFLLPHEPQVDFKKINTEIMIRSFKSLGVDVQFSGRNDLVVGDRKISGSAFKINLGNKQFKPKSLHHGTILLDVDLNSMQRYLNPNKLKLISKGVDSVKSRVLNLREKYPTLNREVVYEAIEREFLNYHGIDYKDKTVYDKIIIDGEENNKEEKIKDLFTYYNSWDWKFGESPEFTNSLTHKFDWGLVDLSLRVEKGIIQESCVYSDCLNTEFIDLLNLALKIQSGKFSYDSSGFIKMFEEILKTQQQIQNNKEFTKYIEDMTSILILQV